MCFYHLISFLFSLKRLLKLWFFFLKVYINSFFCSNPILDYLFGLAKSTTVWFFGFWNYILTNCIAKATICGMRVISLRTQIKFFYFVSLRRFSVRGGNALVGSSAESNGYWWLSKPLAVKGTNVFTRWAIIQNVRGFSIPLIHIIILSGRCGRLLKILYPIGCIFFKVKIIFIRFVRTFIFISWNHSDNAFLSLCFLILSIIRWWHQDWLLLALLNAVGNVSMAVLLVD